MVHLQQHATLHCATDLWMFTARHTGFQTFTLFMASWSTFMAWQAACVSRLHIFEAFVYLVTCQTCHMMLPCLLTPQPVHHMQTLPWQAVYVKMVNDSMAAWFATATGIMAVGRILAAVLAADPAACRAVQQPGKCSWDVAVRRLSCAPGYIAEPDAGLAPCNPLDGAVVIHHAHAQLSCRSETCAMQTGVCSRRPVRPRGGLQYGRRSCRRWRQCWEGRAEVVAGHRAAAQRRMLMLSLQQSAPCRSCWYALLPAGAA